MYAPACSSIWTADFFVLAWQSLRMLSVFVVISWFVFAVYYQSGRRFSSLGPAPPVSLPRRSLDVPERVSSPPLLGGLLRANGGVSLLDFKRPSRVLIVRTWACSPPVTTPQLPLSVLKLTFFGAIAPLSRSVGPTFLVMVDLWALHPELPPFFNPARHRFLGFTAARRPQGGPPSPPPSPTLGG